MLPSRCAACGGSGPLLCVSCRRLLERLDGPLCACCGAPTVWPVSRCRECSGRRIPFHSARAAVAYAGPARALVRAWKERGLRRFASLAAELVAEHVPAPAVDVVTWVPPDGDRSVRRGYQPARGLADALAHAWNLDAAPLLARTRAVERQAALAGPERRLNVRGAFCAARRPPQAVLLVDDVYTTGATAAAAAAALRAGGAGRVEVVTFARAVR